MCEALTEEITVDPEELAEARWFERDEIRAMVARAATGPDDPTTVPRCRGRSRSRTRSAAAGPTARQPLAEREPAPGQRASHIRSARSGGWDRGGNAFEQVQLSSGSQRTAVVTGASSGIGRHTALGLARSGMRVAMVGRDRDRTEAARRFVIEGSGNTVSRLRSPIFPASTMCGALPTKSSPATDRLDLLVNNAGLLSPKYRFSFDGFELTFAVNHLAPFLLTNLLLERLEASSPARIVTVASEAHHGHRLNLITLGRPHDWSMLRAYGRSKLCNILFTREVAARLSGSSVAATCLHPGIVATAIGQRGGLPELVWRLMKPFMTSPDKGAETSLFLATVPDPKPFHGGYVIRKSLARPDPVALNRRLARDLWDESARLAGLGERRSAD